MPYLMLVAQENKSMAFKNPRVGQWSRVPGEGCGLPRSPHWSWVKGSWFLPVKGGINKIL